MMGYCVLNDHANCPDSKSDSYACSCPCHLGITPHDYSDNGMNDHLCLTCGKTHWDDVCSICGEVRIDHDMPSAGFAGDEHGEEPILSDHYFQGAQS